MTVVSDFRKDWVETMRRILKAHDVNLWKLKTDEDVSLAFWNTLMRRIPVVPRKVSTAREFLCPTECEATFAELVGKLERGEDVNDYRSAAVRSPSHQMFNDRLFNDWGIHHFHLGAAFANEEKPGRSDNCAYVYLTDTGAYLLDVMAHKQYEKQELMLRMHRNWPDVIARSRANGTDSENAWDDDNIKTLRHGGFTYLLKLDGVTYFAPGGGYMKSGHSLQVVKNSFAAFNNLKVWQERFDSEAAEIVSEMRAAGHVPGEPPTFRLVCNGVGYCSAAEYTAPAKIEMGYLIGHPIALWLRFPKRSST